MDCESENRIELWKLAHLLLASNETVLISVMDGRDGGMGYTKCPVVLLILLFLCDTLILLSSY